MFIFNCCHYSTNPFVKSQCFTGLWGWQTATILTCQDQSTVSKSHFRFQKLKSKAIGEAQKNDELYNKCLGIFWWEFLQRNLFIFLLFKGFIDPFLTDRKYSRFIFIKCLHVVHNYISIKQLMSMSYHG